MAYVWLPEILKVLGMCKSTSEARRLMKQGAVKVNNNKITNTTAELERGYVYFIQVGKRRFKKVNLV